MILKIIIIPRQCWR